jgi:hypothetical protein
MPYPPVFLLFLLFTGSFAFAQNMGIIECKPGVTAAVPAFASPGKPHIVAQLTCGQTVRVLGTRQSFAPLSYSGTPREYIIIQLDDSPAYVEPQFVRQLTPGEARKINGIEKPPSPKDNYLQEDEQQNWFRIKKDNLKIRDEVLLNPIILNGRTYLRNFRAIVTNASLFAISHLRFQMRIYDCAGKASSDYSNCEIVGEANSVAAASVPAGQTRSVEVPVTFDAIPYVRGTMAWSYQILGVRSD